MPRKGSSIVYINKITKENSTYNVATLHQVKTLLAVQKCIFKKSISLLHTTETQGFIIC